MQVIVPSSFAFNSRALIVVGWHSLPHGTLNPRFIKSYSRWNFAHWSVNYGMSGENAICYASQVLRSTNNSRRPWGAIRGVPHEGQEPHILSAHRQGASMNRRLRVLRQVRSELPFPPALVAEPRVYEADEIVVNQHGAVAVRTSGGLLGIKPDEFEWLIAEVPA